MRALGPLVTLSLVVGIAAACTGGGAASPSAAPSVAPSTAPSEAPSAAPSASADAGEQVEVIAVDFAFNDVADSYTGPVTFSLKNEGEDVHEMVVVRKNEGVTQTFEELLALPGDEAFAHVTMVGGAIAESGQTAPEVVTADVAGEYLMICFVPQGTTSIPSQAPDASGPPEGLGDGPPHFTLGMLKEFTLAQ